MRVYVQCTRGRHMQRGNLCSHIYACVGVVDSTVSRKSISRTIMMLDRTAYYRVDNCECNLYNRSNACILLITAVARFFLHRRRDGWTCRHPRSARIY